MKRYMNLSLVYAVLAMVGGVFYREFTKFNGFTGKTTLGVVHPHYFLLGMVFFLLLLLLEKNFGFTGPKTGRVLIAYQVGLNLTTVMFVVRGVTQVLGTSLSSGMTAAISGMAGIGHIILGVSLVVLLVRSGAAWPPPNTDRAIFQNGNKQIKPAPGEAVVASFGGRFFYFGKYQTSEMADTGQLSIAERAASSSAGAGSATAWARPWSFSWNTEPQRSQHSPQPTHRSGLTYIFTAKHSFLIYKRIRIPPPEAS